MIKEFCEAWEQNNEKLRSYISTHKQKEYDTYTELVRILFEYCINPYMDELSIATCGNISFSIDEMTVIDNGDYQGTLLFIIPRNTYQPNTSDYIFTSVYYGSCSCCDTLQGIHEYGYDNFPDEEQIKDYMSLLLNILQNCNRFVEL